MMNSKENPEKGVEASIGTPKVSTAEFQVYLKGIAYPVNKQKIIQTARSNSATTQVMDFLNRLPEMQYTSLADVEKAFSNIK